MWAKRETKEEKKTLREIEQNKKKTHTYSINRIKQIRNICKYTHV